MSVSRPAVCVISKIPGMCQAVRRLLPDADVAEVCLQPEASYGKDRSNLLAEDFREDELATIRKAEIMLADPSVFTTYKLTNALSNLKWLQSTWAGVDSIIRSADKDKPFPGFKLTRFSGYFGPVMGEYVVGQMIARERHFYELREDQKNKIWDKSKGDYRLLSDLSIGIVGLGDIGREIARLCKAFGMTVWGLGRTKRSDEKLTPHVDFYRDGESLGELLSACDYVCSVLPNTPATAGYFDGDVLSTCSNKRAVFINVGRGNAVSEDTLLKAFNEQWLSHAILDVFVDEPLPSESRLWTHPQVTISPHVSGMSTEKPVSDLFATNYKRYCEGEPLMYETEWALGY